MALAPLSSSGPGPTSNGGPDVAGVKVVSRCEWSRVATGQAAFPGDSLAGMGLAIEADGV